MQEWGIGAMPALQLTEEQKTEEQEVDMPKEMSNAAAERAAAQAALRNGDLKERDTYTAKQVAARLGTDAKTMRKFFRSSHSTVEPVGQGGRYEFEARDMPKIKKEFAAWRKKARARSTHNNHTKRIDGAQIQEAARKVADEGEFTESEVTATLQKQELQELAEEQHRQDLTEMVKGIHGEDHEPTDEELEEMDRVLTEADFEFDVEPEDLEPELEDGDFEPEDN